MKHQTLKSFFIVLFCYCILPKGIACDGYSIDSQEELIEVIDRLIEDSFNARKQEITRIRDNADLIACLSKQFNYKKGIAQAYLDKGLYLYYTSAFEEGIDQLNQSLEIAKKERFLEIEANSNNFLGLIFHDLEEFEIALSYQMSFKAIAAKLKNEQWLGESSGNIANIYYHLKNYQKALEYHQEAGHYFASLPSSVTQRNNGWEMLHYAKIYAALGDQEQADHYFNASLKKWLENDMKRGLAYTYSAMGNYYADKSLEESIYYYKKGLAIATSLNNIGQVASIKLALSKVLFQQGNREEALRYNVAVIDLCKTSSFLSKRGVEASRLLIERLYEMGMPADAVKFKADLETFKANNDERKNRVLEIRSQYETNLLRKKEENTALTKTNTISRLVIIAVLSILFIISFWGYRQYRQVRKEQKKTKDLEAALAQIKSALMDIEEQKVALKRVNEKIKEKNQTLSFDLTEKLLVLAHKDETLRSIANSIKSTDISYEKKQALIKTLQIHQQENVWDSVDIQFANIHQTLYQQLSVYEPTLTSNELRLCAFVKMQLSDKEIARILYKSTGSIKVAKSRLRKKLNLPDTERLVIFLNQLTPSASSQ